ncbi:MAG TPA: opacity family porin [Candidatus Angelobacter sp.]|nr:opacity family porin [Candidatus Angelobacter sp.]
MIRIGSLLGALIVTACLISSSASAQTTNKTEYRGLGFQGLGARIGFVDPEGTSSTVDLGIHVDAGEFVQHVHIIPLVEYWKVGVSGVDVSDLSIGSDINVDFPVEGGRVIPYAGGGLGLHFVKADDPFTPGASFSDTKLGLNLQGGIRNQVMPNLGIFGEVKYNFVSNVNQLKLMGGFTYNFIY